MACQSWRNGIFGAITFLITYCTSRVISVALWIKGKRKLFHIDDELRSNCRNPDFTFGFYVMDVCLSKLKKNLKSDSYFLSYLRFKILYVFTLFF